MQMIATSPKPQEPSMEEILASIRRIIADDQDGPKPAPPKQVRPEPSPSPVQPEQREAPDLAEGAPPAEPTVSAQPAPSASPEGQEDAAYSEADLDPVDFDAADLEEPVEPELPAAEEMNVDLEPDVVHQPDPEPVAEDHLLSRVTDQSVSHAFNMLTHTVLSHNARTLEDLVKDMLRPMLKSWLDENLPIIVERLVRAEIERVARGGR
jgi:cell pole-organizing protein PopZ